MSVAELRAAATKASGFGSLPCGGAEATLAALRRLGAVQIDSISVVERAHHHVLATRNADYLPEHIRLLEDEPRKVIEYWSHAAAYLPIEDFRFCLPRMERVRAQGHEWFKAEPDAVALVLDKIRAEGPLRAQDFAGPMKGPRGWWDWKPAKIALEYLFHAGLLVALTRKGFQKVYELAERALPGSLDLAKPSPGEMAARYVDQAVSSLGIFTAGDIAYLRKDCLEDIPAELAARVEAGSLIELETEDQAPGSRSSLRTCYASPVTLERLSSMAGHGGERVVVISPFDPLIIDRKRTARIFGREFQLECYLPEPKRLFGYFALPLLSLRPDGDASIIGLLDAKAERGSSCLVVRRLSLDPALAEGGVSGSRVDRARVTAAALWDFAALNRLETIELQLLECNDGRMERSLRAAVARLG